MVASFASAMDEIIFMCDLHWHECMGNGRLHDETMVWVYPRAIDRASLWMQADSLCFSNETACLVHVLRPSTILGARRNAPLMGRRFGMEEAC